MDALRGSSSPRRTNAGLAGHEASARRSAGQFPFVRETPAAHLRNALAITQLLDLDPSRGTLSRVLVDVTQRIALALEELERVNRQTLPEPTRVAHELIHSIGQPAATELQAALARELAEMDRTTNSEIRNLRLAEDDEIIPESNDADDATGRA